MKPANEASHKLELVAEIPVCKDSGKAATAKESFDGNSRVNGSNIIPLSQRDAEPALLENGAIYGVRGGAIYAAGTGDYNRATDQAIQFSNLIVKQTTEQVRSDQRNPLNSTQIQIAFHRQRTV